MPETSHYLGIDWGKADIGLAVADSETRIAMVLGVLKNDRQFLQKLADVISINEISDIIIGIPSYINHDEVDYEGEKIGKVIEKKLNIKVHYQNEMFTTKMAQANLIEKGIKGIKKHDDEEAARIILQDWLDKKSK